MVGSSASTALVISLLAKKPIILWNVYGVEGDVFLERGLALECHKIDELIPLIHKSLESSPSYGEKLKEFVQDFLYKPDGKATERIAEIVLRIAERNNKKAMT